VPRYLAASRDQRLRGRGWSVTPGGCWEAAGHTYGIGYVQIMWAGKQYGAHRLAYEAWVGPIPEGALVLHSCDNPPCINPEHLSVGSHQENMDDRARRGRASRGERHPASKLSDSDAATIRRLRASGSTQQSIADQFGISQAHVSRILNRKARV
jgi:hypothetical protein